MRSYGIIETGTSEVRGVRLRCGASRWRLEDSAVTDMARRKNPDVKIPVIGDYPAVAEISGEAAI
ncbi:MAG: hypothetical protein WCI51_22045 [Lentisphaerota bacterium]